MIILWFKRYVFVMTRGKCATAHVLKLEKNIIAKSGIKKLQKIESGLLMQLQLNLFVLLDAAFRYCFHTFIFHYLFFSI